MKTTMKAILLVTAMLVSCMDDSPADFRPGELLPEMSVTMSDGTVMTKKELSEGESIVMVFNLYHPQCDEQLRIIQRLHEDDRYGVRICLLNMSNTEEEIRKHWELNGYDMPYSTATGCESCRRLAGVTGQRCCLCRWGIIFNTWDDRNQLTEHKLKENIQSFKTCK